MATDSQEPALNEPAIDGQPNGCFTASGWEAVKIFEKEIETYLRELPRLLNEGYRGKTVLVRGDQIHSIWDTRADAVLAGRILFGLDPIFVKTIDHRDPKNYKLLLDSYRVQSCPSS